MQKYDLLYEKDENYKYEKIKENKLWARKFCCWHFEELS